MKASPMSEEFHDWLDKCPVQWFRGEVTKDHVTYSFETPEEDEEKKASSLKLQARKDLTGPELWDIMGL